MLITNPTSITNPFQSTTHPPCTAPPLCSPMEGQDPPSSGDDNVNNNNNVDLPLFLLPLPPTRHATETYVIQIPKDQIYRVPPPEHAIMLERFQDPDAKEKKKRFTCLMYFCLFCFSIGLIVGFSYLIMYFSMKPSELTFSIKKLIAKNPKTFEVLFDVKNPNEKQSVEYEEAEEVNLLFGDEGFAKGKFEELSQKEKESSMVNVKFIRTNQKLPSDVDKSLKETKKKVSVCLNIEMNVPLKFKHGPLSWKYYMDVDCKVKVSTLGNGSKIVTQDCKSNFK